MTPVFALKRRNIINNGSDEWLERVKAPALLLRFTITYGTSYSIRTMKQWKIKVQLCHKSENNFQVQLVKEMEFFRQLH